MSDQPSMRAAVYHGPGDIRVESVAVPPSLDGETLVRVLRSGLCGTDVSEWASGPHMIPLSYRHPHSDHQGPMIPGHEFIGEVVSTPAGSGLDVGALVASGAQVFCGECQRCSEGRVNICERLYTLGLNANGGHAEFVAAPSRCFVPVPPSIPLDFAGLAQPLAVGVHAARRSRVSAGDSVLISGAGAIGSFVLVALKHMVPDLTITVTDVDGVKLDRAVRLGASSATTPVSLEADPVFDVTIEASGVPGTLPYCLERTRSGGTLLCVGLPSRPVELDVHELVLREITLETTVALVTADDLPLALTILDQRRAVGEELLDSVRPLEDAPGVLEAMVRGEVHGKVLLDPSPLAGRDTIPFEALPG